MVRRSGDVTSLDWPRLHVETAYGEALGAIADAVEDAVQVRDENGPVTQLANRGCYAPPRNVTGRLDLT